MGYFTRIILFGLYYLISKLVNICYSICYSIYYCFFSCIMIYYCISYWIYYCIRYDVDIVGNVGNVGNNMDDEEYYYGHFDYKFLNENDKKLTKYFYIN